MTRVFLLVDERGRYVPSVGDIRATLAKYPAVRHRRIRVVIVEEEISGTPDVDADVAFVDDEPGLVGIGLEESLAFDEVAGSSMNVTPSRSRYLFNCARILTARSIDL